MPALYTAEQLKPNTTRVGNKYNMSLQQEKCVFVITQVR